MKARIASLLSLLCMALLVAHTKVPEENRYEVASRQCVLVDTVDGSGSGFVFHRTDPAGHVRAFVWTAAHVVKAAMNPTIQIWHGRKSIDFPGHVIALNEELDVALIAVEGDAAKLPRRSAKFASAEPLRLGDPMFVIGSPYGYGFFNTVSFGRMSRINVIESPKWHWRITDQYTATIFPGNSGGPAYNDSGEVVGIVVGGLWPNINVFVPVRQIEAWSHLQHVEWAVRGERCPNFAPYDLPGILVDPEPVFSHSL